MSNAIQVSSIEHLKNYMNSDKIQKVFDEMVGTRKGIFTNTITNVVRGSTALQKCTPASIVKAAITSASFSLSVDPAIGHAAIVPYGTEARFQIMYRGITQLCIRSGQYKTIHCTEIYADELLSHNPITGIVTFKDPAGYKLREKQQDKDVIGHYAAFVLNSGFSASRYISKATAMAHGLKYSKAYQRDIRKKEKKCPWLLMPIAMCNKTVYLQLMRMFGIMSIELQSAIAADSDNSFEEAQEQAEHTIETDQGQTVVDAEFKTNVEPTTPKLICDKCNLPFRRKGMRKTTKTCECPVPEVDKITGEVKPEALGASDTKKKHDKADDIEFKYTCNNCKFGFDVPKTIGAGDTAKPCCPNFNGPDGQPCFSTDIEETPF